MFKTILLFSDGTGNSSASVFKTNVFRVYDALDRSPEKGQIAFYDDGVGTSSFKFFAILGGAFGFGLKRNVLELYKFLSREYDKAKKEGCTPKIACFGFSRGAYTIRVLIALIESQGLLPFDGEAANLDRWAPLAYEDFRKDRATSKVRFATLGALLRDTFFFRRGNYDPAKNIKDPDIDFLGLWDTVGAYGMPVAELERAIDNFLFSFRFSKEERLSPLVKVARHALSIDDERDAFTPIPFDERYINRTRQDLVQLWFAGVHANVGGGYPDDTMSYAPLNWILQEAREHGVAFRADAAKEISEKTTSLGKLYDSRAGFGGLYRYKPRALDTLLNPKSKYEAVAEKFTPLLHESVIYRLATSYDGYAPIALPPKFAVANAKGQVLHEFVARDGAEAGEANHAPPSSKRTPIPAMLAVAIGKVGTRDQKKIDRIRFAVFWRQVMYQFTLIPVVILAFLPLVDWFWRDEKQSSGMVKSVVGMPSGISSRVGDVLNILIPGPLFAPLKSFADSVQSAIGLTVDLAGDLVVWTFGLVEKLVPSWAQMWPKCFQTHPCLTLFLISFALVCFWWGGRLKTKIDDRSRAAWNDLPERDEKTRRVWDWGARKILGSKALLWTWDTIVINIIPAIIAVLIGPFIILAVVDRAVLQLESYYGFVCRDQGDWKNLQPRESSTFEFKAASPCNASGLRLERGKSYRLTFDLPKEWGEKGREADLSGFKEPTKGFFKKARNAMAAALSLRSVSERWFTTILRVGSTGANEIAPWSNGTEEAVGAKNRRGRNECSAGLVTKPVQPRPGGKIEIELTNCSADGQLFAFVNDAYNGFLPLGLLGGVAVSNKDGSLRHTYGNNLGVAKVTVTALGPEESGD